MNGGLNDARAGWFPDPAARFELRYHNGSAWTADVSNDGERFVDPFGTQPAPPSPDGQPSQPSQHGQDGQHGQPEGKNGAATAALVLGVIAVGLGWLPFIFALAAVAAVLAIVLGVRGRRRARQPGPHHGVGEGMATAGLVLGPIGLLVCVGGLIFSITMVRAVDRFENPASSEAQITACDTGSDSDSDSDSITASGALTNTSDESATYTVRVQWVRPGTDNAQAQANVVLDDVGPGETRSFEATRSVGLDDVECIIGAVRGELPFGIDPGT